MGSRIRSHQSKIDLFRLWFECDDIKLCAESFSKNLYILAPEIGSKLVRSCSLFNISGNGHGYRFYQVENLFSDRGINNAVIGANEF